MQSYEAAIRFRPRLAVAHLNLALTLTHLGRKQQAIDVYRRCAALDGTGLKDPKNHESTRTSALFNLGRLYSDDGRFQDAISVFQEAVQTMPAHYQSHSLFNVMGDAFSKMNQFDEAERWYLKALSVKADHVPAHLTLAKLYARMNRTNEAEKLFVAVQSLAPNDTSVHQHYGPLRLPLQPLINAAPHRTVPGRQRAIPRSGPAVCSWCRCRSARLRPGVRRRQHAASGRPE